MKKGFTLVELVIVIGLIAILIGGVMAALDPIGQIHKGNDVRRKSDLSQVQKALEVYYNDFGAYPAHSTTSPMYRIFHSGIKDWGKSWAPYMSTLPEDPKGGYNYIYYSEGQSYYLYVSLERGSKDPGVCSGINNACSDPSAGSINMQNACGGVCNYGVSSSNVSP